MPNDAPDHISCDRSRVDRIRDQLLPDCAFEEEIAAALRVSRRYVQRLNLPYRRIGDARVYELGVAAREALQRLLRPPEP